MGEGDVPVHTPGESVPPLDAIIADPPEIQVSEPIDEPAVYTNPEIEIDDTASPATERGPTSMDTPVPITQGGGGWIGGGTVYTSPEAARAGAAGQGHLLGPGQIIGKVGEVMGTVSDIGDAIWDEIDDYLPDWWPDDWGGGGDSPPPPPPPNGNGNGGGNGVQHGPNQPYPVTSCAAYVWNPRANCGAGKWQKRSRGRRKRMATASDIKDLSALKSVLGPSAMKTWIATHS